MAREKRVADKVDGVKENKKTSLTETTPKKRKVLTSYGRKKLLFKRMKAASSEIEPFLRNGSVRRVLKHAVDDFNLPKIKFTRNAFYAFRHILQHGLSTRLREISSSLNMAKIKTLKPEHVQTKVPEIKQTYKVPALAAKWD